MRHLRAGMLLSSVKVAAPLIRGQDVPRRYRDACPAQIDRAPSVIGPELAQMRSADRIEQCPNLEARKIIGIGDEFAEVISSSGTAALWGVGPFDCGGVPAWKIDGPKRIFPGWRQLCDAIAAPSTDVLKRSSWYRIRALAYFNP